MIQSMRIWPRLFFIIHSDHESGNASAHATHLVGFDPFGHLLCSLRRDECPGRTAAWACEPGSIELAVRSISVNSVIFPRAGAASILRGRRFGSGQVIPGYGHADPSKNRSAVSKPNWNLGKRTFRMIQSSALPISCMKSSQVFFKRKAKLRTHGPTWMRSAARSSTTLAFRIAILLAPAVSIRSCLVCPEHWGSLRMRFGRERLVNPWSGRNPSRRQCLKKQQGNNLLYQNQKRAGLILALFDSLIYWFKCDFIANSQGVGVVTNPVLNQLKTRGLLTAPAGSQIGLPSVSVPICRTGTIHQRITCGIHRSVRMKRAR